VEQLAHFFLNLVDATGYPGLFLVVVLSNVGIPSPIGTETVLPAAGALVATGHLSSVWIAAAVATLAELAGGTILYTVGYTGGRPFVVRWGKYFKLDEHKLDAFDAFYERHGSVVVFVCRLIPIVRGISALPAGISRMQLGYFLIYTALGSAIFCSGLILVGNALGQHFDEIRLATHRYSFAFGLFFLAVAAALFAQHMRVRANKIA